MNILLAAATIHEIAPILKQIRSGKADFSVDIVITGVGLVATTYSLTHQLQVKRPSAVIQAGIGGSFNNNIATGSVVVIKKDIIADQGVVEGKKLLSSFDLGLTRQNQPPYQRGWLVNKSSALLQKTRLPKLTAISVNQVTTDPMLNKLYRQKFNPAIESMEGAALHYVCLLKNIPFIQFRAVSNTVGERDKSKWKMKPAIENLNLEIGKFLKLVE